jgi:hypothetical protein
MRCCASRLSPPWGLTPRSRRGPTANHQARLQVRFIILPPGLALCRRSRLTSNVRPRMSLHSRKVRCASSLGRGALARWAPRTSASHSLASALTSASKLTRGAKGLHVAIARSPALAHLVTRANAQGLCMVGASRPRAAPRGQFFAGFATCVPRPCHACHARCVLCRFAFARPNPSLKRSANGRAPGPVSGALHSPQPGPDVLPLSPA